MVKNGFPQWFSTALWKSDLHTRFYTLICIKFPPARFSTLDFSLFLLISVENSVENVDNFYSCVLWKSKKTANWRLLF